MSFGNFDLVLIVEDGRLVVLFIKYREGTSGVGQIFNVNLVTGI